MIEFRDIAALVTACAAILSVLASLVNRKKIELLHLQINSRMDEWIKMVRDSALAEGRLQGVVQERKDTSKE